MLDTGTVNTWITAASCTTVACKMHRAFNPDASSSYVPIRDLPKSVPFGPWGSMTVLLGNDKASLQLCKNQEKATIAMEEAMNIYLSIQYDGTQFAELDRDGGLAIPSVSCDTPSALLEQLKNLGLVEQPVCAFYFNVGLAQSPGTGRSLVALGFGIHRFTSDKGWAGGSVHHLPAATERHGHRAGVDGNGGLSVHLHPETGTLTTF